LLATPLFGLSLTPPAVGLAPDALVTALPAPAAIEARIEGAPALTAALPPLQAERGEMAAYAETLRERSSVASIHRPLGISTWAAMTGTLILGFIQYNNLYGFFADAADTPCVTGDAVFGQGQCYGTPWIHLTSAMVTTALYGATFVTSLLMPDPGDLEEGDSGFAGNLRMHKLLRWIHFGGMVAQIAMGFLVAQSDAFGIDRANDYGTLQLLGTVHMGLGLVTWGALSWAAALMVF